MNILGIIPARGGSKGIPRKNVKLLGGKPLIAYTIEACHKSEYVNRIIVSTDDKEIADISVQFGAEVIERPIELALDEAKTAPVVVHTVNELEKTGYTPDIIVLLPPTSPFRDEKIIDAALKQLIDSGKDSIFTGHIVGVSHGIWKKCLDGNLQPLYDYHLRPRRQEKHLFENFCCENGALYAVKSDIFKKTSDFLGDNVDVYIMDQQIDIDEPADFELAEKIIQKSLNTK